MHPRPDPAAQCCDQKTQDLNVALRTEISDVGTRKTGALMSRQGIAQAHARVPVRCSLTSVQLYNIHPSTSAHLDLRVRPGPSTYQYHSCIGIPKYIFELYSSLPLLDSHLMPSHS